MEDILISGFQLRKDFRLPSEVAEKAIEIWRLISTAEISSKPWTYEADAGKPGQQSPMVRCGCELPECLCITLINPAERACENSQRQACKGPCECKSVNETFEVFKCVKCDTLQYSSIITCPLFQCGGECHSVKYCSACRKKIIPREAPAHGAKRQKIHK